MLALKEVTDPYLLGLQLGIEPDQLKKFEREDHLQRTERRKIEVIMYWLRKDDVKCSWETLADAVERMKCHGNVVKTLRTFTPKIHAE